MKNVRKGLETRTKIVDALGRKQLPVGEISRLTGVSARRVRYHLRNMQHDGVVVRKRVGKRFYWMMTGAGQASLDEALA
ncbi:MAG: winged helix-turn-helix domain-containing protein [Candidatus Caldarchaeum sp.]|nr:winged helix-turn-helix domain-containing protein [Candidatus Caldarchaeum sp.]